MNFFSLRFFAVLVLAVPLAAQAELPEIIRIPGRLHDHAAPGDATRLLEDLRCERSVIRMPPQDVVRTVARRLDAGPRVTATAVWLADSRMVLDVRPERVYVSVQFKAP